MPFRIAISGLQAAQTELNVIGNNIANVNTSGFKQSRAEFQSVYAVSNSGGGSESPGRGVNTARIAQQFTQGNISFTNSDLDLAISGQGFFILDDNGGRVYSREGAFGMDRDGYVVNANGQRIITFGTDDSGIITSATGPLQIRLSDIEPAATTRADLGVNLDAAEAPPSIATFDPLDAASYNSSTAVNVYDSLGSQHIMQVYFIKAATPNTWNSYATVDGTVVNGPAPMAFDSAGSLTTPASGQIAIPPFTPPGGAAAMNVTLNVARATQFGSDFGVNSLTQDGYASGRFVGIDIDEEGVIFARFSNGRSEVQGQVALANFANPQGLRPLGENTWAETFSSGLELEGAPGTASLGLLQNGALEDSNVDLSEQLVRLIVAQRNFQANTQVISTANAVTQAVIGIR
jgi:flagellar hook protein FlgE